MKRNTPIANQRTADDARDHAVQRMNQRVDELVGEIGSLNRFAQWLAIPDTHLGVLFNRLSAHQRKALIEESHKTYCRANASDCNIFQFSAYALFVRGYHPSQYAHLCRIVNPNDASLVSLDEAENTESTKLIETLAGRAPWGCARIFYAAREAVLRSSDEETLDLSVLTKLQSEVRSPIEAASLLSISAALQEFGKLFDQKYDSLKGEASEVLASASIRKAHTFNVNLAVNEMLDVVSKTGDARRQIATLQKRILRPDILTDQFKLDVPTGLLLPEPQRIILSSSLDRELQAVLKSPDVLHHMSPRKFEEFARDLFVRLGYEVELTQASRDGGADLLCLRSLHGIPVRFAVELKRYKADRPINVSLVRSFVGSNLQHQAHRLIYVTTSYYTQPAMSYASNHASHLLELRKYEHIQEWCQDALRGR